MHTTTRRPAGVKLNSTAELTSKVTEPRSQFLVGNDRSWADERRTRLRRGRIVGFSVLISLWALSVVPLARELMGDREGAAAVLVYLAAVAISLGVAAVIRSVYVLLTKRRFWSPWMFLMAAVVAIVIYTVQGAGIEEAPIAGALWGQASS